MYKRIVVGLTLFGLLTILLGACAIVDTSTPTNLPTVHMGGSTFLQPSITIHKGDMLNLVDDAASTHIIANGTWDGTTPKPATESGAPTVNKTYIGNDSGAAHLAASIGLRTFNSTKPRPMRTPTIMSGQGVLPPTMPVAS